MVQAMIDIPQEVNQVLNIVKARFDLNTKSEAITKVVLEFGRELLEPELRPEFIKESKQIMNEKKINIGSIDNLKARYGL